MVFPDYIMKNRAQFVTALAVELILSEAGSSPQGYTVSDACEAVRAAKEVADKLEVSNDASWSKSSKQTKRSK